MRAPSVLMQNQEGVRGKPEAEDPWFAKQEKCGYEQESFLCDISGDQRTVSWLCGGDCSIMKPTMMLTSL